MSTIKPLNDRSTMNLKNIFCISTISLFVMACNEDYSAGVSLGGTGTGRGDSILTTAPKPEIKPDPTETPEKPESPQSTSSELILAITYPDTVTQNCQGLQRTLSFINPSTHELKIVNSQQFLDSRHNIPNDIGLRLEVCNTTAHQVYEYIDQCQSPLQLIDEYNEITPTIDPPYVCQQEESIHLYNPHQCKTYIFKSNIRSIEQQWRLRYQTQYSFDMPKQKNQRTQCDALETRLPAKLITGSLTDSTDQEIVSPSMPSQEDPINQEEDSFIPITPTLPILGFTL